MDYRFIFSSACNLSLNSVSANFNFGILSVFNDERFLSEPLKDQKDNSDFISGIRLLGPFSKSFYFPLVLFIKLVMLRVRHYFFKYQQ